MNPLKSITGTIVTGVVISVIVMIGFSDGFTSAIEWVVWFHVLAGVAGIEELPSRFSVSTWNFRDVFASLSQNAAARSLFPVPFPLQATRLVFETGGLEFDVGASSVRYFSLASGLDAPALAVALRKPTGGVLSETTKPQITIVRTR